MTEMHFLTGNDAMNKMLDIYMSGMAGGLLTAFVLVGYKDEDAEAGVNILLERASKDPAVIETFRKEIAEIMTGDYAAGRSPRSIWMRGDRPSG